MEQETPAPPAETPPAETPPTTPTETPPAPPTEPAPKDNYTQLLEATLREQNAKIQELQAKVTQPPAAPPEPTDPAEARNKFFNEPHETVRSIVKKELEETIAPLKEFVLAMRGEGTPYGQLKARFAKDPRYAQVLSDPKCVAAIDKLMEPHGANEQMFVGALTQVAGLKFTGQLDAVLVSSGIVVDEPPKPQTPPSTPPAQPSMTTPPHMRPTPPAPPTSTPPNGKRRRELTENEARLARERGMTPEQFLDWIELPASQVASSTIGRAK